MSPEIQGFNPDFNALVHARTYLGDFPPALRSRLKAGGMPDVPPFTSYGRDELKRYLQDVFDPIEQYVTLQDEDYNELVSLLKQMLAWDQEGRLTADKALRTPFFEKGRMYQGNV